MLFRSRNRTGRWAAKFGIRNTSSSSTADIRSKNVIRRATTETDQLLLCFNLSFLTLFVLCAVVFVFWSFLHFNSWTFCTPVGPDVTQSCTSRFLSEHAWYLKWWGDFHSFLPNHSHLSFCSCQLISSILPSIHPSTVAWPQFFFLYAGRFTDNGPSSSGRHFELWSVTSSSDHQKCVSKKHLKCFSSNQSFLWTDQQLQFTFCNKYHIITHTAAWGFPSEMITDCLQEDRLITIAGKKKKINKSLRNQQPLIFISAILWVDW